MVTVTVVVTRGPVQCPHVRGHAVYKSGTDVHKSATSEQIGSSGVPVQRPSSSLSSTAGCAVVTVVFVVVLVVTVLVFVVVVGTVVFWHTPHMNGQPFSTLTLRSGSKHVSGPMKAHADRSVAPTHLSIAATVVVAAVVLVVAVTVVAVLVVAGGASVV